MKAGRKRKEKKNIFEDDQQDEQSKPQVENKNDLYQAAKIQENVEAYIRDTPNKDKQYESEFSSNNATSKRKKKLGKNNKKKLFDSDEDQSEDKSKKIIEQPEQGAKISDDQEYKQVEKKNYRNEQDQEIGVSMTDSKMPSKMQLQAFKKEESGLSSQVEEGEPESVDVDEKEEINKWKQIVADKKTKYQQDEQNIDQLFYNIGSQKQQLKRLLFMPLKQGFKAELQFIRIPSGFSETYRLAFKERSLIFCENQRGCIGANYYFSMTKEMDKKSPNYLGKLRGNSAGSTYMLYDNGSQPSSKLDRREWRATLAKIDYQTNILGINGPRKLHAYIPKLHTVQHLDFFKLSDQESLESLNPNLITKLRNKQPKWNQRLKSFALNFGGRVKLASIKNFIMINDQATSQEQFTAKNLLVFGKASQNVFSLEIVGPLSIFQAFGIVMSAFDFKFNCQ